MRQAREERGISISEVAEQTRISPMYLELIENDDYRTLPGGIFNKGFVKSYAKYVGLDEQEALQDYAQVVAAEESDPEQSRTYRPEVLTDDRTSGSMIPTVIFAVIILGLMTWGILALVNYIQENQNRPAVANTNTNSGSNANTAGANANTQTAANAPLMGAIKVEVKTTGEDIAFSANLDGKNSYPTATLSTPVVFEPKEVLEFSYLKLKSAFARLTINGREIPLPTEATDAKGKYIQIKINAETLPQMWQSSRAVAGAPSADATPPTTQAPPVGDPPPATAPSTTPRTAAVTSRSPQTAPSPARTASPVPSPRATVIIVPSAPKTGATSTPKPGATPRKPNER